MKKSVFTAILLFTIPVLYGQKVFNDVNAEKRLVTPFHGLQVSGGFEVVLSQGNEAGVAVSANEKEYVPHIVTKVENGILKIWYEEKRAWWPKNRKLKAYVSVKNIDELRGSGATDFQIEGQLAASSIQIHFSGASDLKGKLEVAGNLTIDLSGASDITISGSANETAIKVRGASDVKGYDFKTSTCSVEASGASGVHITVDKEILAQISGASSVSYKGNATVRDIRTSGASNISHKS